MPRWVGSVIAGAYRRSTHVELFCLQCRNLNLWKMLLNWTLMSRLCFLRAREQPCLFRSDVAECVNLVQVKSRVDAAAPPIGAVGGYTDAQDGSYIH
eukprot:6106063-Amphidinium_carterae.1